MLKLDLLSRLWFLPLWLAVAACGTSTEKKDASSPEMQELKQRVDVLLDSIEAEKALAMASEDEKEHSVMQIVEELEQLGIDHDQDAAARLKALHADMLTKRYAENSMENEELMIAYDAACDSVMGCLRQLRGSVENFDNYRRASMLYKAVEEANSNDLFVRRDYNAAAYELNKLLQKRQEDLQVLGEKYASLKPVPYFYAEPVM